MKRIQRAKDKEDIIKLLMDEKMGLFKEIWKLMLFSAMVGYKNNCREPLGASDPGKGIDQSTFGNSPAWPGLLYLLSLAEYQSTDYLCGTTSADDTRISLFQEYANGGLKILNDFFSDRNIDLDGIIAFIDSQRGEIASVPDLDLMI